jgi:hypothetical protein
MYAENINFALWEINQYVNQTLDILTPDQQHEENLIQKLKWMGILTRESIRMKW